MSIHHGNLPSNNIFKDSQSNLRSNAFFLDNVSEKFSHQFG